MGLLSVLFLGLVAIAGALGVYAYYAAKLPSPQELYQRTTPFRSTKIYDRNGKLLFEVFDPLGGRRTIVRYDQIPEEMVRAVTATEDATFFFNPGLDPLGIVRALYHDLREGEIVQGASTITQQLVKNLFLTQERTWSRKVKEAILAAEITRRYSKVEILEVYFNEVYFGNLAYGIGAASETYFGKHVSRLTLVESALLAGLLQSPAFYDPYTYPEAALERRAVVLGLMYARGHITRAEHDAAMAEPLGVVPTTIVMEAPHMVMHVRQELEKRYGTEMLYKGGLQVYTTLDLDLQHLAEEIAQEKIAQLRERKATNAALIAVDPHTGDILAMLGSADFYSREIDGQVNVTDRLRQPGSTLKPLTYLAAMERGWTAATMLMDVAQAFPDGANPPYRPQNYDLKEYGPISLRTALACSRNIPAVSTLHQVGLPAFLEVAHRLGIYSLNRPDYGLSLTLGGGEATLIEMAGAYATFASGGYRVEPRTLLYIEDQDGKPILPRTNPGLTPVMDPRHAYLLTDILADESARERAFGANSALKLSFPAAAKTGTTNDYRDSWIIGYTPDLVCGVWVGNSNNAPMDNLTGARGAGLIWHDFMERALASPSHPDFPRPDGLVEIEVCPISGQKHTSACPPATKELFLTENVPQECTVHKRVRICTITGKLATDYCPVESVEERAFEDYGPEWDAWAQGRGIPVPPRETCPLHQAPTRVEVSVPPGSLWGIIPVYGRTEMPEFAYYAVEFGAGKEPEEWKRITPQITSPVYDGVLCRWDAEGLADGTYTLRLIVADRYGQTRIAETRFEIERPTPTPIPSPTWTQTPSPTVTPSPVFTATSSVTLEPSPSAIPTSTAQPTATPWPTDTPQATPTSQPSSMPTPTPSPTSEEPTKPTPSLSAEPGPASSPSAAGGATATRTPGG